MQRDSHENKVLTKNILYFPQLILSYFILYMYVPQYGTQG